MRPDLSHAEVESFGDDEALAELVRPRRDEAAEPWDEQNED
jgi:hypothetical protein